MSREKFQKMSAHSANPNLISHHYARNGGNYTPSGGGNYTPSGGGNYTSNNSIYTPNGGNGSNRSPEMSYNSHNRTHNGRMSNLSTFQGSLQGALHGSLQAINSLNSCSMKSFGSLKSINSFTTITLPNPAISNIPKTHFNNSYHEKHLNQGKYVYTSSSRTEIEFK